MEALKRFADKIAHDFNNVLTGVLGFAQLISMDLKKDDQLYLDVKEIEKAAKKGKAITEELLFFGQKKELDKKDADIIEVIMSSVGEVKSLIKTDIIITTDLKEIPLVSVDKNLVGRAIESMILNSDNAIESAGKIHLAAEEAEEGKYVMISIADDGKGASAEDLPHINEPYYKTKKGRKTSLGATIAYEIIKEHGGRIDAEIHDSGGMRFKILLPV
ncbi:MAG: HAMP domain-containing sensor histidine kinase [Candidatus Omnitrophota bacterium]